MMRMTTVLAWKMKKMMMKIITVMPKRKLSVMKNYLMMMMKIMIMMVKI